MKKTHFVLALSLAGISGTALAHPGLLTHAPVEAPLAHTLIHFLMLLPFGLAVYVVSRLLLKRSESQTKTVKYSKK